MENNIKKRLIAEFDEMFTWKTEDDIGHIQSALIRDDGLIANTPDIQDFITYVIDETLKEVEKRLPAKAPDLTVNLKNATDLEIMKAMLDVRENEGYNQYRNEVIKLLEEMKK